MAEPISHYCDAVEANGFLFVSGCPATDESGALVGGDDTAAQCAQVLRNLGAILAAGGCTPQDVVKVNVYLTDVGDRPLINPLRQAFFGNTRPASTLVGVRELPVPGMKVEIEAVAVVPASQDPAMRGSQDPGRKPAKDARTHARADQATTTAAVSLGQTRGIAGRSASAGASTRRARGSRALRCPRLRPRRDSPARGRRRPAGRRQSR